MIILKLSEKQLDELYEEILSNTNSRARMITLVLYSTRYDNFNTFKNSIGSCIADLGTRFKANMQTLMTMNFQLFSKKSENLTA